MLNSMYKPQKMSNFWQVTSIIRFVGSSVSWSLNEFYSLKFTFLDERYEIMNTLFADTPDSRQPAM